MSNPVAEQLATLLTRLEGKGWKRLNGNTWRSGTYTLRTAYVWGEATVIVKHDKAKREPAADTPAGYYRGADLLTWAATQAVPVIRKNFGVGLDKPAGTP